MIGALYERAVLLPRALGLVLRSRRAIAGTAAVFVIFGFLYAMILPATDTGGIVGLVSLRFLTPLSLALAVLMASLLALTVALAVYGFRGGGGARPARGVLGAVLAVIPSLFCCSPVLPLAIAAMAAVLPAAGSTSLPIQGFIATHEGWIYGAAVVLMVWGLYGSARRVLCCDRRRLGESARIQATAPCACREDSTSVATNRRKG